MKKKNWKQVMVLLPIVSMVLSGCSGTASGYRYSAKNVDADVVAANESYQKKEYEAALTAYLDIMGRNPKDINARLGAVECQIELGQYETAWSGLEMISAIDPRNERMYTDYFSLSEKWNDILIAEEAVEMASRYAVESILEQMPERPQFNLKSGNYNAKQELTIQATDGEDIVFSMSNDDIGLHADDLYYSNPVTICHGDTKIEAYAVKDGIPSEKKIIELTLDYEEAPVTFEDPAIEYLARKELDKEQGTITDFDCEKVTELDASDLEDEQKIHSLKDLRFFPCLNDLDLYDQNEIQDYTGLKYCQVLELINLNYCDLTDISFLTANSSLYNLQVGGNQIKNADVLSKLKNLRSVYIEDNQIDDLSALFQNAQYETVSFDTRSLKDFSVLKIMPQLRDLRIEGLMGIDYRVIAELTELTDLDISYDYRREDNMEISDLSFLQNLTKLDWLSLDKLSDSSQLKYVEALENLTYLNLYNCDVTKDKEAMRELEKALPNCQIRY